MDSMQDLLNVKKPQEPPQLLAMKNYVLENHNQVIKCRVSQFGYTIIAPNAVLASILHMETPKIIEKCELDKKLFIRIGHF
jgi:hypothetical protein